MVPTVNYTMGVLMMMQHTERLVTVRSRNLSAGNPCSISQGDSHLLIYPASSCLDYARVTERKLSRFIDEFLLQRPSRVIGAV